jgi:hypothetical protein
MRMRLKINLFHFSNYLKATIILMTLTFLFNLAIPASAAGIAIVRVDSPSQFITPGSQFTIDIVVQPNNAIAGVQSSLIFDPSLVTVNSISEGNLLTQNGASTYFISGQIDNAAGTISNVAGVIISPGQTVSASGTFAEITLTAKSVKGTCPLTLSNVIAGDINGQPVSKTILNGQVIISDGSNSAPVLNSIGNKSTTVNKTLSFGISATDIDGDILTYSALNLPSGASFNPANLTFFWKPDYNQTGTFPLTFMVSDGTLTDSENINITVNSASSGGGGGGGGGGGKASTPTLPEGTTDVSSAIGPDGVFNNTVDLWSANHLLEMIVPQGTKSQLTGGNALSEISLSVSQSKVSLPEYTNIIGAVYNFGPEGVTFDSPVTVKFVYDPSQVPPGANEKNLSLVNLNNPPGSYTELESLVDIDNQTVTTEINHFSLYAIVLQTQPAHFGVGDLSLSPVKIYPGDSVDISIKVTNDGDLKGTFPVQLKLNDKVFTEEVTLTGGDSEIVHFKFIPDNPGEYDIDINGEVSQLKVDAPLKADFALSPLILSSSETYSGEALSISALITNSGNLSGTTNVQLKINGMNAEIRAVSLDPGKSQEVKFSLAENEAGIYQAEINGLKTSFTVIEKAATADSPGQVPEKEVSLSLLAEIIGGSLAAIALLTILIMLRYNYLIRKRR